MPSIVNGWRMYMFHRSFFLPLDSERTEITRIKRFFRPLLTTLVGFVLLAGTEARAHLTINLAPAHGVGETSNVEASLIESLFPSETERMARVLERLPEHAKAWPGMLILKVGSRWASITIVFPDDVSTRMVHLGAVTRPIGEWSPQNQMAVALIPGPGPKIDPQMLAVLSSVEQTIGDPYRPIYRDYHDDGNIDTPTLLELRLPLDGLALVRVIEERARLEREFSVAGEAGPCTADKKSRVECTLGPILSGLVGAAYGAPWTPNVGAISPLGIGLDLARTHGPQSLRGTGCPMISPRREADDEVLEQKALVGAFVGFLQLVGLAPEDRPADASDSASLMRDYPDLVELALGGVHDPEGLSLIECALRREILHGEAHPLPNTILRSRWYDRATHLIDEGVKMRPDADEGNKPELFFFDAASHVTRTLAIGLVDLVEREAGLAQLVNIIGAKRSSPFFVSIQNDAAQKLGVFAEDSDIDQTELPTPEARALLRDLNLLLFRNNRQMIREVKDRLERASNGAPRFPDPAAPPGAGTLRHGLWFDLRMVLFEQGLIERVLVERRKQPGYSDVVADIDSSARLGQALAVAAGYQRSAWIDRLVYGAVARVEARITAAGRYVRSDGGPIYAPEGQQSGPASFDTYWHRITIGSTYGVVLRYLQRPQDLRALCRDSGILEVDRLGCREAVERLLKTDVPRDAQGRINYTLDQNVPQQITDISTLVTAYMRLRLENAPRPEEGMLRQELEEIATSDFTNGLETELAQVLAVLRPREQLELLHCSSVATGPEWKKISLKNVDFLAVRRALVDPQKRHWTTLADLYDIMRGGALPRAPRLGEGGTRDSEICEGIRIRQEAVAALLDGKARPEASPVRIPYADEGGVANVGIDEDRAVWLRAMARQIWPHLANETCKFGQAELKCGDWDNARTIASATIKSYSEYRRTVAALRLLSKPESAAAVGALGYNLTLGTPAALLTKLEGPPLSGGPRILQEGNTARLANNGADTAFLTRFDMAARLQRLKDMAAAQAYLASARKDTIIPLPIPITPRAGDDDRAAEEVAAGQRTPAGLRVETVRTGQAVDETGNTRNVFTGKLTYILPVAAAQLGPARLDPKTATRKELDQLASVAATSISLRDPVRTIPLGLTVTNLARLGDGRYTVLEGDGSNQVLANSETTASALRELGLPDIFRQGSQRLAVKLSADGALDVTLTAIPDLSGIELNSINVALIKNGVLLENVPERLAGALQASFTDTFNQRGVQLLSDLLSPFEFDTKALPGAQVAFRFDPEASCVTLAPTGDCDAPPALASIKVFEPSVQAGFKLSLQTDADLSVAVTPKLNLTLTRRGVTLRGTDLSDLGDEALAQIETHLARVIEAKLVAAQSESDGPIALSAVKVSLGRSNTVAATKGLNVGVRLMAAIRDACDVPVSLSFDLSELDNVDNLLNAFLESGKDAAEACVKDVAVDAIENVAAIKAFLDQPYRIGDTEFSIVYDRSVFDKGVPDDAIIPFALLYDGDRADGLTISLTKGFAIAENAKDRKALDALVTRAFAARLSDLLGGVVRVDALALTQAAPGRSLRVMADLTVDDVPFLGDIKIPRINLADPDTDGLAEALRGTLVNKVAEQLHAQLPNQMDIPFVGMYTRTALSADLSDTRRPKLALEGTLRIIEGLEIPATIGIPLKGSLSDLVVEIKEDAVINQLNAFSPLKDAFDFGPLTVSNARIGPVPSRRGRYAVFLDAKVGIDGLFKLGVDNLMIDQDGLKLGATISGSIPYPVETTVVSLSSIGVTIYTGEDGAKSGLVLDTDISALTAASAALAKVNARLDLRDIGNLAFRLDGDVIVLNSIPLLFARGDVALNDLSFTFEAGTVPALENIISLYGAASLEGKENPPVLNAQTRLAVLRVKLEESEFKLTIDDPGNIYFLSETNMLIAKGNLKFSSGLDLSDLDLSGGMRLDLFGWSPGGVFMAINARRSRADIKVLFAKLGITVRHADLFDPQVVIDMLMSLFDISLEDLLKIRIDKLEIAAGSIGADGSTGNDGQSSDGSEGEDANSSDADDSNNSAPSSPRRDTPPPDPETGATDRDDGHPANEGGTIPGRRYCDPIIKESDGTLRYRFRVYNRDVGQSEKSFSSHPHPGNIRFHGETFRRTTGDPMSNLCTGSMTNEALVVVGDIWVPRLATRNFSYGATECIDGLNLPLSPPVNGDFALEDDEGGLSEFPYNRAKSPVLCWRLEDGSDIFAYAQIFEKKADGVLRALIFCNGPEQIAEFRRAEDEALYKQVCVNGPMSRDLDSEIAGSAMVEVEAPKEWSSKTIRIVKPAAEQSLIEKLRADLMKEDTPTRSEYTLANGVEARVTGYNSNGRRWSRVSFVVLNSGSNASGYVFDDELSKVLNAPTATGLAKSLLQAWYDRSKGSRNSRPELILTPLAGDEIKLWLQGYNTNPDIDSLDWVIAGGQAGDAARPAIKVAVSRAGSGPRPSVKSDFFQHLTAIVLPIVEQSTTKWPGVRHFELILSEYDALQNRRYMAIRPQGMSASDNEVMFTALIPSDPNNLTSLNTYIYPGAGPNRVTLLTHAQLRCRIKVAHDRSAVKPLSPARTQAIDPWKIFGQPSVERERLNLSNDPIQAMYFSRTEESTC